MILLGKPDGKPSPAWVRYAVAVGCVILGWLAREALTPAVGPTALPFISFFPAIAMAAWYGGLGAGVLATLLSAVAAHWFFIEPVHSWSITKFSDVAALVAFLIASGFIIGAMEAMHRAHARARAELTARERAEAELARLRGQFATTLASVGEIATTTADGVSPLLRPDIRNAKRGVRLIALLFLAAALLVVGTTILVYRVGLIRIHAQQKMARELLVLHQLDDFLSAMKDAETGQRGYVLTGDESYLEPYTNVRAQVQTKLDGLERLGLSGELPKEKVQRVGALTQQKLALLEQRIQLRGEQGFEAALASMRVNPGKQVMDDIRAQIGEMRAQEEKEFADSDHRASWAAGLRTATFFGAALLNLVFLFWAFRRISRESAQRETAMLEASQKQELLATTLGSIGDGVIATDTGGCVLFLNPEAEKQRD
jgi:CHASE3 domain sensor protein